MDGFSLHAAVHIPAHDRDRLEHLCRYIARPPFAAHRLTRDSRGRLLFQLRRSWRDGTTHVVFAPLVFLERLAALVPPPCMHLQTYHGVLAPAASWREEVVRARGHRRFPRRQPSGEELTARERPPHGYLWSQLMRRVFGVDVLPCARCRSRRRLVALITARAVIVHILAHLGLPTEAPSISPARAPPQLGLYDQRD